MACLFIRFLITDAVEDVLLIWELLLNYYELIMRIAWLIAATLPVAFCYRSVSKRELLNLSNYYAPEDYLNIYDDNGLIAPIMVERIPDTDGHMQVQKFINDTINSLPSGKWDIEIDRFQSQTPKESNVSFTNIIATRDPPTFLPGKSKRLVIAAHYDSKIDPEGFLGAIDSAVPCGLMLYLMGAIDEILSEKWTKSKLEKDTGLQFIFFDGEEAFETWTYSDSLYGARHLAEKWATSWSSTSQDGLTKIQTMDLLLLLDLLGSSDPKIYPYFPSTEHIHTSLSYIDKWILKAGLAKRSSPTRMFSGKKYSGFIMDDHVPFMVKGVPVVHIIPGEFPPQWHTIVSIRPLSVNF